MRRLPADISRDSAPALHRLTREATLHRQIRETSVRFREAAAMHQTRMTDRSWLMVALLFLFMLVNFADKAVIGLLQYR